ITRDTTFFTKRISRFSFMPIFTAFCFSDIAKIEVLLSKCSLNNKEAEKYIQHPSESICIVTDIHSDAGYCFLTETTARNYDENKRIAEILERRYF
ncbi:MAG: hypothetical protein DRP41_06535, partial [Thermodesulfobacteriota bacterium]